MRPGSLGASKRTYTFANAAALADADGFKTSVATDNAAAHSYSGAALNGALANPGPAVCEPPRYPSVTATAQPNAYNITDPIVFNGIRGGIAAAVAVQPTDTNGNWTLVGSEPLDRLDSIDVPRQLLATGAFTFGWSGVGCPKHGAIEHPFRRVRAVGAGNLKVGYTGGKTDTFAMADAEKDDLEIVRVYPGSDTTVGVKLYE